MTPINQNIQPKESPPTDEGAGSQFERFKQNFQNRLESIKQKELSTENIDTYADDVLSELIDLVEYVTEAYAESEDMEVDSTKQFENEAFAYFDLQALPQVLDRAYEKAANLDSADQKVSNTKKIDKVITPPDPENPNLTSGKEDYKESDTEPRYKTVLYVLEEQGVDLEEGVDSVKGVVPEDMMRNESYVTVSVPDIDRVIQVCDEVGNASYVFKLSEVDVDEINDMTKSEKNDLLEANPEIGIRIEHRGGWQETMKQALFSDMIENDQINLGYAEGLGAEPGKEIPEVATGELDEWQGFYTDEDELHWGTTSALSDYFDIGGNAIRSRLSGIRSQKVKVANGQVFDGYCLEDCLEKEWFQDMLQMPRAEKSGKWKGFYKDPDKGYFGSLTRLTEYFDVSKEFIRERLDNVDSIEILSAQNRKCVAYSLDQLSEKIEKHLSLPQLNKSGEWKGFYRTEDGEHYGSIWAIAKKLGVSHELIEGKTQESEEISRIEARDTQNRSITAYSFEDLDELVNEQMSLPRIKDEGQWEAFTKRKTGSTTVR